MFTVYVALPEKCDGIKINIDQINFELRILLFTLIFNIGIS